MELYSDFASILDFGASSDGTSDTAAAFAKAFAAGVRRIRVPAGEYRIDHTLALPSGAWLEVDENARIFAIPGGFTDPFMIANAEYGASDIKIRGGIWDGVCGENKRASHADTVKLGLMFNFIGVDGLVLENLRMFNASSYHVRLGEVKHFRIENVSFEGELTPPCQDGIHMGGGCEYGLIRGVKALPGTMGDDLIALNADDYIWFGQNIGMKALPIRHIRVEDVDAPHCYTVIRILSVNEEVSDCYFKNFRAGYRAIGINLDSTHRCGDAFKTFNRPGGVGNLRDITFENFELWYAGSREVHSPIVSYESNSRNVRFINFRHVRENDTLPTDTINLCSMAETVLLSDGEKRVIGDCEEYISNVDFHGELVVNSNYEVANIPYPEITN
ncbi:MAG: hypothetical protein IJ493_01590 [Clostridia bacterium]|nr:hypothetical protein [Clostridia bacterium]